MRIEPCVRLGKRQKTSFAGLDKRNFCEVINSRQRDRNSRALDDLRRLCRVRDLWFLLDVIDFKGDAVRESVCLDYGFATGILTAAVHHVRHWQNGF